MEFYNIPGVWFTPRRTRNVYRSPFYPPSRPFDPPAALNGAESHLGEIDYGEYFPELTGRGYAAAYQTRPDHFISQRCTQSPTLNLKETPGKVKLRNKNAIPCQKHQFDTSIICRNQEENESKSIPINIIRNPSTKATGSKRSEQFQNISPKNLKFETTRRKGELGSTKPGIKISEFGFNETTRKNLDHGQIISNNLAEKINPPEKLDTSQQRYMSEKGDTFERIDTSERIDTGERIDTSDQIGTPEKVNASEKINSSGASLIEQLQCSPEHEPFILELAEKPAIEKGETENEIHVDEEIIFPVQ
jgi:hypothetical protein